MKHKKEKTIITNTTYVKIKEPIQEITWQEREIKEIKKKNNVLNPTLKVYIKSLEAKENETKKKVKKSN